MNQPLLREQAAQFALTAHTELFGNRDISALERHFAPAFIEHSPLVANGLEGLASLVTEAGEALTYTNARVLADGDLVALHGSYTGLDKHPLVGFDLYRLQDGKLVEHWDGLVPLAGPNSSGRTQLDGPTTVDRTADPEANRALVTRFFERALIGEDYSAFRDFIRDGQFLQHSPDIGDGTEAVIAFLEELRAKGEKLTYDRTHRTVADGQFVLTQSEGSIAGERHSYYELWRVENGAIAELWDAISPVPADSDAVSGHGVF